MLEISVLTQRYTATNLAGR